MSGLPVPPLIAQCALSPTVDPSCGCLLSDGGPAMNTDINGSGVRISFYLQALFLACLALYTSVATNIAMSVTSLILGFKPSPGISFHDAIVVLYLLALSWASVFFSLVSYNRFVKGDRSLKYFSILQSYILFAFAIAVLRTAPHFGYAAPCNSHAVVVIFRPFRALHTGVNAAWVLVTVAILVYTIARRRCLSRQRTLTRADPGSAELGEAGRGTCSASAPSGVSGRASSCANVAEVKVKNKKLKKMKKKKTRGKHGGTISTRKAACVSGDIVIKLAIILILWALAVLNIELLIIKNNFLDSAGTSSE
ncbi:hypothetical protein DFH11DRAFT_1653467 [Phellopilus nigrolimitatus]|nr:hypothetical protein DFH11DRAFT_1653467 [Phellopilus nigrolimitatus]